MIKMVINEAAWACVPSIFAHAENLMHCRDIFFTWAPFMWEAAPGCRQEGGVGELSIFAGVLCYE